MDPTPPTSAALLVPTWEGEADTHCEHQKGAGRTESPGGTPVPQSHPWAAPSVRSTSPRGPSWPGGISAAVWPLTTPDLPSSTLSSPSPLNLSFTLHAAAFCLPSALHTQDQDSSLVFDPGGDIPHPPPTKLLCACVLGGQLFSTFQGFSSPQSLGNWEIPNTRSESPFLPSSRHPPPQDIDLTREAWDCSVAAPAAPGWAGASLQNGSSSLVTDPGLQKS